MRTHSHRVLNLGAALLGGAMLLASIAPASAAEQTAGSQVYVNKEGWSPDEARGLTKGLERVELITHLDGPGDVLTVGVVKSDNREFDQEVLSTLQDMEEAGGDAARAKVNAYRSSAAKRLVIDEIRVPGDQEIPDSLRSHAITIAGEKAAPSGSPETAMAASCGVGWQPNYIKMSARPSSVSGQRYGATYFRWTNNDRLANLKACGNVTFEPDFVTYNYDGLYYYSKKFLAGQLICQVHTGILRHLTAPTSVFIR